MDETASNPSNQDQSETRSARTQTREGTLQAWADVVALADKFEANSTHYLSGQYQEAEARKDFIDKFFVALGWDVLHDKQHDPYRQEVKIEKADKKRTGKADYAFSVAPFYHRIRFFVEAKRPQSSIVTPDNCFQAIRYSWPLSIQIAVLTDFKSIHIIDSRFRPSIDSATSRVVKSWELADYRDFERFSEIYWLLSREAVADGSIDRFSLAQLPEEKLAAKQYSLFRHDIREFDEAFLGQMDEWREQLAVIFNRTSPALTGEQITEAVQRTLDRLIFIRFLEDKQIEEAPLIVRFGSGNRSHWQDFVRTCARLDSAYNGIVFKRHRILDEPSFTPSSIVFATICDDLTDEHSPYNFDSIPVEILGRIYERFLGSVVRKTSGGVVVEQKPDVRKAGGVYYTPDYIVRYMVESSLGALTAGQSVEAILALRIIDTSCGSGSFLIGVFDHLVRVIVARIRRDPSRVRKVWVENRDGEIHASMRLKREILLRCIYGVDIDAQAVEVAQLSLFLQLLSDETTHSARNQQLEMGGALLPSLSSNIVEGNSLVTLDDDLYSMSRLKEVKSLDFKAAFAAAFERGGFDLVIGNPPYIKEYTNREAFTYVRSSPYYLGKLDIWYLFACRGMDWLKPKSGILAFIATNNWITNAGARLLRRKIAAEARVLQLIDFGNYRIFKDAGIQTMIIVLQKSSTPPSYDFDLRRLTKGRSTLGDVQALLEKSPGQGRELLAPTFARKKYEAGAPFLFSGDRVRQFLDRIEACANFTLDGNREIAQGIVPNIDVVSARSLELIPLRKRQRYGIRVGDGVFVVGKGFPSRPSKDERRFLKPLYEPGDVDRYAIIRPSTHSIIYSRKAAGPTQLPARLRDHLAKFREIMERRRENQAGRIEFYHLHWPREERFFIRGPKILCVRKSAVPTFVYTESEAYVMMAFNVIRTDRVNMKVLTALFNSRLIEFWLRHRGKMQGHQFQIDREPLMRLPILVPDEATQESMASTVTRIISLKEELSSCETSAEEERLLSLIRQQEFRLNAAVEELYGLTTEEKDLLDEPKDS